MDEFKAIADKYHVQIRGIHGEHSESAEHVYDISNRHRLGPSEVDLVQDMYDGVKALIAREKELQERSFFDFPVRLLDSEETLTIDQLSKYFIATIVINVATDSILTE